MERGMSDQFVPPEPPVENIPVAEITTGPGRIEYDAYPVKTPVQDIQDFKLKVRASTLTRCRTRLAPLARSRFPWHELFLAVSTLAGGAWLGALPSPDIKPGTFSSHFFYAFLPLVSVASFVAYIFLRKGGPVEAAAVVTQVLDELPDPDKAE
jgi:hypothetical protein